MKAKKPYPRSSRLSLMLQKEISSALLTASDPQLNQIVICKVVMTENLANATIWYEILGLSTNLLDDQEKIKLTIAESLSKAKGFIRTHVAKNLPSKKTPFLQFFFDDTLMNQVL